MEDVTFFFEEFCYVMTLIGVKNMSNSKMEIIQVRYRFRLHVTSSHKRHEKSTKVRSIYPIRQHLSYIGEDFPSY